MSSLTEDEKRQCRKAFDSILAEMVKNGSVLEPDGWDNEEGELARAMFAAGLNAKQGEAVPTLLCCPACETRHIDEGEWVTKLHKTHQCQQCGHEWRPYQYPTVGVARFTIPPQPASAPMSEERFRSLRKWDGKPHAATDTVWIEPARAVFIDPDVPESDK